MNKPRLLLMFLLGAAVAQLAYYLPQMPPVLASHYDAAGNPNGWMSRSFAGVFHAGLLGVVAAAFLGLPLLLGRLSSSLINVPNREYWLAPARRQQTVASLQSWMALQGCGVVALLLAVGEMSFQANLHPPARLPGTLVIVAVGGFLAFTAVWMIALYRRFRKPA